MKETTIILNREEIKLLMIGLLARQSKAEDRLEYIKAHKPVDKEAVRKLDRQLQEIDVLYDKMQAALEIMEY